MTSVVYTVLHYEDEPLTVDWLRDSIYLDLCDRFPHFADLDEDEVADVDENAMRSVFTIEGDNSKKVIKVVYSICDTRERFLTAMRDVTDLGRTVVILDLMGQGMEELEHYGEDCYWDIPEDVPYAQRFFLSGYTKKIPPKIGEQIGSDHIFRKPVNVSSFTGAILSSLSIVE